MRQTLIMIDFYAITLLIYGFHLNPYKIDAIWILNTEIFNFHDVVYQGKIKLFRHISEAPVYMTFSECDFE